MLHVFISLFSLSLSLSAEYWRIERTRKGADKGGAGVVDLAYPASRAHQDHHYAARWRLGRRSGDARLPRGMRSPHKGGYFEKYLDGGARLPSIKLVSSATPAETLIGARGPDDRGITALDDDLDLMRKVGDDRREWSELSGGGGNDDVASNPYTGSIRFVDAKQPRDVASYFAFSQAMKDLRLATCATWRSSGQQTHHDGALSEVETKALCAPFECECQGISDMFGTAHSRSDFARGECLRVCVFCVLCFVVE